MKTEGYKTKQYGVPVKRYCQTLSLKDNPELIKEYRRLHSEAARTDGRGFTECYAAGRSSL